MTEFLEALCDALKDGFGALVDFMDAAERASENIRELLAVMADSSENEKNIYAKQVQREFICRKCGTEISRPVRPNTRALLAARFVRHFGAGWSAV